MTGAVKFLPNRVWRVYRGGSGIDLLRRAERVEDGHFPEDWIASTSPANNPQYPAAEQGLSRVAAAGREMLFGDWLAANPEETLGREHAAKYGANAALLMKILTPPSGCRFRFTRACRTPGGTFIRSLARPRRGM